MSEQTRGQKIVQQWTAEIDKHDDDLGWDDLADLAQRIDQELAKDRPKLTLDLTEVFKFPKSGRKNGDWYLSEKSLLDAIRTQLPGIDVIT